MLVNRARKLWSSFSLHRHNTSLSQSQSQSQPLFRPNPNPTPPIPNPSWVLRRRRYFSTAPPLCWNCSFSCSESSSGQPFLACPSCNAVQPVDSDVDFFRIFGIEKGYEIKENNLEGKYKDWQKKLHPDLVHTKSERERSYAAEQSARVIEAYRTLRHPISRALYVLQLEGMEVDEEKTFLDPELLTEVMEIREAVEEANEKKTLDQIKSQIQQKFENWSDAFANAFKNRNFDDAVASIRRMIYYEKAIQEIVKKL